MKKAEKKSYNSKQVRLRAAVMSACVAAAVIIVAVVAATAAAEPDSKPYHAEFARRSAVHTAEASSVASAETSAGESGAETTPEEAPAGLAEGAFRCALDMKKTAWGTEETPKITLSFGLIDDSYGEGDLRLRLYCDDFFLSDEIFIEEYTFDLHSYDGREAPDSAEISLLRGSSERVDATGGTDGKSEFAFGKLYLSFEFIPDGSNTVFGGSRYDYGDDDDMADGADAEGVWVGGFWCSYSITPAEVAFARREVDSGDYFAERVIKQYRDGRLDKAEFCRGYYFLALHEGIYISATSPIMEGSTLLGYYSPTLRARAREPVNDEEILALVAKTGPYPDEHDDTLSVSLTRARELAVLILGVLRDQGVISGDEYAAELEACGKVGNIVTSPPEFNRAFKKYRKIIEDDLITHE